MRRPSTWLLAACAAVALGGCPLKTECNTGRLMNDAGACVCPPGAVAASDGTCVLPDGGAIDFGPDAPSTDAGPCGHPCTGTTPICFADAGTCVECNVPGDCSLSSAGHVCDGPTHRCVACASDADCTTAAAPKCDLVSHACMQCGADADCMHLAGTHVCDTSTATHTCVQCTAGDYTTACAPNVCDASTHTCASGHAEHSQGLCGTCVADAECMTNLVCVDELFPSMGGTSVGPHCFQTLSTVTGMSCLMLPPFAHQHDVTSVDGMPATICDLALTTCDGRADYRSTDCAPTGTPDDTICGAPGVMDGVCRMLDATHWRCTTLCLGDVDCDFPATCPTTSAPRYCAFF